MRVKLTTIAIFLTMLFASGAIMTIDGARQASASTQTCTNRTKVIYARGSGQKIDAVSEEEGYSKERYALQDNLNKLIPGAFDFIDLGVSMGIDDLDYPAIKIWEENYKDGIEAVFTKAKTGKYKESVEQGKELLVRYLMSTSEDNCFVLLGYSQGAHVVGEMISDDRLSSVRNRIVYVGLMGDPKFDTYGRSSGLLYIPGSNTPWYRGNAIKVLQSGILGPRSPYVIYEGESIAIDTGSWCYRDDVICANNPFGDGHGKYVERAIPQMAHEIANAISKRKPIADIPKPTCGALKQDVVVAVNVSPSVINDKYFLADSGLKVVSDMLGSTGCDVRTAMVTFGRKGFELTQPVFDFGGGSVTTTLAMYRDLPKSNVIEKADVAGAVDVAMDMSWRQDAQKMIIVLSDAPGDNYTENFQGIEQDKLIARPEMRQLLAQSRQHGGIEIHAARIYHPDNQSYVYTPGATSFYTYMNGLVQLTAGTYRDRERCNFCSWLDTRYSFRDILTKKPALAAPNIRAVQGQPVSLAAKDISAGVLADVTTNSYDVSYNWFIDCGTPEVASASGMVASFTPKNIGMCHGALLMRQNSKYTCNICYEGDPYGIRAVTTFTVEILPKDYQAPPIPLAVQNIKKERLWQDDILQVSWDPPANTGAVGELAYIVKDSDGSVLGVTSSTKLHITDVSDDDDVIVTVSATSGTGVSDAVSSTLAQDVSVPRSSAQPATTEVEGSDPVLGATQLASNPAAILPTIISMPITTAQILGTAQAMPDIGVFGSIMSPIEQVIRAGNDKQNSSSPWWMSLAIIAVTLSALATIGYVVKYGLRPKIIKF